MPVPHLPRWQLRAILQGRLCVLQQGDQPVHGNVPWALTHTIPGKHPAPEGLGCSLKYSDSFPKCQPCSSRPPSAEPVLPASPRTALGLHGPSGSWKQQGSPKIRQRPGPCLFQQGSPCRGSSRQRRGPLSTGRFVFSWQESCLQQREDVHH